MKLRVILYAQLLLYILLVVSCVTEFQPGPVSVPASLIVEGEITDQPGPYAIALTRTADYSFKALNLLETGATVTISDNLGNRETLRELFNGVYLTAANGIQGVAGRAYKLIIQTKAGKRYESDLETLQKAPPILKLYSEYSVQAGGGNLAKNQGWDVYLDAKDPDTLGNYYRWVWTHYQFTEVCSKQELSDGSYSGLNCCSNCWDITRCYSCISISSDANINGQSISRQFIMRAPYKSTAPYYLEVQQQAISKGACTFWKSVKGLVTNTGGLFDSAPATARGNIRCINDTTAQAYGFFGATGLSEQAIYIDRSAGTGIPDIDPPVIVPVPSTCVPCQNTLYRTHVKPRWWKF